MHAHNSPRSSERSLPTENPQQLSLPGIEPLPEARYPLLVTLGKQARRHRFPITASSLILFLFLVGQGTIATGLLFAVGLFFVNTLVDRQMGGDRND